MHTISIFVDQNRMPKLASYFECQTHLAKKLRNSANFILRNLRTGLKKDPVYTRKSPDGMPTTRHLIIINSHKKRKFLLIRGTRIFLNTQLVWCQVVIYKDCKVIHSLKI